MGQVCENSNKMSCKNTKPNVFIYLFSILFNAKGVFLIAVNSQP